MILVLMLQAGCAWRIHPPAEVAEPEEIFVTSYGWHTRLALPGAEGERLIEYGFGDWRYYALEERSGLSGLRALFASDASAWSRRVLVGSETEQLVRRLEHSTDVARVTVERERVRALRERLESRWEALDTEIVFREWEGVTMARIDEPYHLFHNSNAKTAEWLRELGCEVEGVPIRNNFRVVKK